MGDESRSLSVRPEWPRDQDLYRDAAQSGDVPLSFDRRSANGAGHRQPVSWRISRSGGCLVVLCRQVNFVTRRRGGLVSNRRESCDSWYSGLAATRQNCSNEWGRRSAPPRSLKTACPTFSFRPARESITPGTLRWSERVSVLAATGGLTRSNDDGSDA